MPSADRHERRLLALGGEGVPLGGYGLPVLRRPATIEGLFFIDQPRRVPDGYEGLLGDMFREFYIVENNRTQERGLVARMEIPAGSMPHLQPYQPGNDWPDYNHLGELVAMPPAPVLRVQWVPDSNAWGVARHGRAGGTMVDRIALGEVLGQYPTAKRFLGSFFWTCSPRSYEENEANYREQLARLAKTDPFVRANQVDLMQAFWRVVQPVTGDP